MRFINYRPPRIAMVFVLVATALHGLVPEWGRFHTHPWFGITLAIIGFAVMLWGWWLFKEQAVAICPTAETARLVTHAIYRFTRNPMYLGLMLILLGLAVHVGSLPYYLATAAYFSVMN